MVRRFNRLLVAIHIAADAISAVVAFAIAYLIRFNSGLIPITKGWTRGEYVTLAPLLAVIVPLTFQLQGLYRLRRGRTRVDDFFAVLVGSILAVLAGVVGTLFVQAYYNDVLPDPISRIVWILFLGLNVLFTYGSREIV